MSKICLAIFHVLGEEGEFVCECTVKSAILARVFSSEAPHYMGEHGLSGRFPPWNREPSVGSIQKPDQTGPTKLPWTNQITDFGGLCNSTRVHHILVFGPVSAMAHSKGFPRS